jgi:hypothetical protein
MLKQVLLAVFRYQNPDWIVGRLQEHVERSLAPILVFYDSALEQDILTKKVCDTFKKREDLHGLDGEWDGPGLSLFGRMDILWFYTRKGASTLQLSPSLLEAAFLNLLSQPSNHDIGVYPFSSNQERVERIQDFLKDRNSTDGFVTAIRQELDRATVILFSGFPPMSKRMYNELRKRISRRIKLIFLCSSQFEPQFLAGDGLRWRKDAIPSQCIRRPTTTDSDIANLERRIRLASNSKVAIGSLTRVKMTESIGGPLPEIKDMLIKRVYELNTTPRSAISTTKQLIL